jgi:UDP-N-acetylglucosamine--N-acetylmuramyl-(pentapeptide) pyrophosphoryl-undecaprenol N-acetylglucosamine transferase
LPTIIHEQNAVLGRANRMLARRAGRIATAFETVSHLPKGAAEKAVRTGMPVRAAFARLRERPYQPPEAGGPIRVLVLGGSQGARVFGEVLPAAIDRLTARWRTRLAITQQCRPEALAGVEEAYRKIGVAAELSSFFDDVPQRLAAAHLLISRAGASSVAEMTSVGCPAMLVPYPHATDDHQTANARAVVEAGGAWLIPQNEFTPEHLSARLDELFAHPQMLAAAAAASRAAGFDRAAARLADLVLEVMGTEPPEAVISGGRLAA